MLKKKDKVEAKNDWMMDEKKRAFFWAQVKDYLGYLPDPHVACHNACGVTSMKLYEGTLEEALAEIAAFAEVDKKYRREKALAGVKTLSVTYERKFNLGNYESLHIGFTAWADVPDESDRDQVQTELWTWVKTAVKEQALPVLQAEGYKRVSQTKAPTTISPQAVAQAAASPSAPSAPPPIGVQPPSPPPPGPQAPSSTSQAADEQLVQIEYVKVTAPKGSPRIEFWRYNREYPEVTWSPSAEAFFKLPGAEQLAAAGWTPAHFATASKEQYALALNVYWTKSPRSPAGTIWKDIVRIELR